MEEPVLLLTGTIDSGVYSNVGNKITNLQDRLHQYESCIERYIKETPFSKIVFIENSGYPFDENKFIKMAGEQISDSGRHKEFEFISGSVMVDDVLAKGKSFGDAYLIYEALHKSKLLQNAESFYKITGRIFLLNSSEIVKTHSKHRNEFIVYRPAGWCLTNIFKANISDYLEVFGDSWKYTDETTTNDIEITFFKLMMASGLKVQSFNSYPVFDGIMGATLRNYSGGKAERMVRECLAKMHCFYPDSKLQCVIKLYMILRGMKGYK